MADGESESWSDDPVRMYLTQMGEIPLLTRQEEISLAKRIEVTRARFRRMLMECDFVIQYALRILNRVHAGELPFDRTVQVSVTDRLEKEQILGRLPHNLGTVQELLRRNKVDFRTAFSKSTKISVRRDAWRRLNRRRKRAVRLVEELGLRTQRIETMIKTLEEFSRRADELKCLIDHHKRSQATPGGSRRLDQGIPPDSPLYAGNAGQYANADSEDQMHLFAVSAFQARTVRRQFTISRFDRQEISQSRLELSRSHSGRQRWLDAGRR